MSDNEDYLLHYGKKGMKWGKRRAEKKAAREERNATIQVARGKQAQRKMELNKLTTARLNATSQKGKAHLDAKIADKKFELQYHNDAKVASQKTTGEKWLRGGKSVAILGLSVVGMGTAAKIVLDEADKAHVDYLNANKEETFG